jgi:hypothetical protein
MEKGLQVFRDFFIDPVAVALLEENAQKLGVQSSPPVTLPLPPPPVLYVSMALTSRTASEEVFSRWLHTFPTHLPDNAKPTIPQQPNSPSMTEVAA